MKHRRTIKKTLPTRSRSVRKQQRSIILPQSYNQGPMVQEPPWNFRLLKLIGKTNWGLRMIYRALRQEALSPRWLIEPRFVCKCTVCGAEYDKEIDACEKCGGKMRRPDEAEYQRLEAFMLKGKPNKDTSWIDFFASSLWYDAFCGGYWWSVAYSELDVPFGKQSVKLRIPSSLYIEDPEYMRYVADKRGQLGGDEWYCPTCYPGNNEIWKTERVCPRCGQPLTQTFYVQQIGSEVKARFGKDEMIIGSTDRILPELYPTPRPVALWKQLLSMFNMDDYNYEIYKEGKVGGIATFPGYENQKDVDELEKRILSKVGARSETDVVTGEAGTSKRIKTLFLASKEAPVYLKMMEDLDTMQSLDFYKFWRDACCSVYGVTPVFVSIIESGRAGNNPRMQLDVQSRTTREIQANFETTINDHILPLFAVKDWIFTFEKADPTDELRDARVEQLKYQTALIAATAGFNVRLDDFGELEITGQATGGIPLTGSPSAVPNQRLPEEASLERSADSTLQSHNIEDSMVWMIHPQDKRDHEYPKVK